MKWTVSILDTQYTVEAIDSYQAKRLASLRFIKQNQLETTVTKLLPACRIRRHEDNRVKHHFTKEAIPEEWKKD